MHRDCNLGVISPSSGKRSSIVHYETRSLQSGRGRDGIHDEVVTSHHAPKEETSVCLRKTVLARIAANGGNVPKELLDCGNGQRRMQKGARKCK
jgi:hypothetical protein